MTHQQSQKAVREASFRKQKYCLHENKKEHKHWGEKDVGKGYKVLKTNNKTFFEYIKSKDLAREVLDNC